MLISKIQLGVIIDKTEIHLTAIQQLQLRFTGSAFLYYAQPEGYSEPVEIHIVRCPEHGYYLDTPHGFPPGTYFTCDKCRKKIILQRANIEWKGVEAAFFYSPYDCPNTSSPKPLRPTNQSNGA